MVRRQVPEGQRRYRPIGASVYGFGPVPGIGPCRTVTGGCVARDGVFVYPEVTLSLQAHLPTRIRLAAFAVLAAMSLTGCSVKTFAVNKLGDTLSAPGPSVYTTDDDPELIRAALPFSLKTVESLLQASPKHKGMLLTACSGFTSYANAFVQLDAEALESTDYAESERLKERARRLYLRGRDYCMRRVELKRPGLRAALARRPGHRAGHREVRRRRTLLARRVVGLGHRGGRRSARPRGRFPGGAHPDGEGALHRRSLRRRRHPRSAHHPRRHVALDGRRCGTRAEALRARGGAVEGQVGLGLRGHGCQRGAAGAEQRRNSRSCSTRRWP